MKISSQEQPGAMKQKVMLVLTIVLFIFLAYLVYNMFFSKSGSVPRATSPVRQAAMTSSTSPATMGTAGTPISGVGSGNVQTVEMPEPSKEEKAILKRSEEIERQYLSLVSEYQLAQIQQKLAQTNAQIAQSKLSALKATSEAKKFDTEANAGNASAISADMKALYVGYNHGTWMAMLSLGNSMYQVHVGTRLPDGSTVSGIGKSGVILNKNGRRIYLAIPTSFDKPNTDTGADAKTPASAATSGDDNN
jgi:flagellar basal body-associated protein FliL